uniref:IF rod domain-containing protein n=1 Tax=Kryptolebias marmoratus TaxID=37003 RepID=A0A3Q2ZNF8_KRYMA
MSSTIASSEKVQLQNLNSRLEVYTRKVRALKSEKLTTEEILKTYESTSITEMYEEKMRALRTEVETLSKTKVERDILQTSLNQANQEKNDAEKELKETKMQWEIDKKTMEAKTKKLEEQMEFEKNSFKKEVSELKEKVRETQTPGSDETDMSKSELQVVLEGIRENYERIAAENINKAETLYKDQVKELKSTVWNKTEELTEAHQKIKELLNQIQEINTKINILETTIHKMNESHTQKESIITRMNEEMKTQQSEYQKLVSVKTALTMEISIYRQLLEKEEQRMKISKEDHSNVTYSESVSTFLYKMISKEFIESTALFNQSLEEKSFTWSFLKAQWSSASVKTGMNSPLLDFTKQD